MEFLGLIVAGIFGAIFGSYSTLFIHRLPLGESCFGRYFGPKSRCPECKSILRTRELIPVINWLFTMGKCTSCKRAIPKEFLLVEILLTALFALCYLQFSFTEDFILMALISAILVILVAIDYGHKVFPSQALVALLLVGAVNRVLVDGVIVDMVFSVAVGAVCAFIFYQIFYKKFENVLVGQQQSFDYTKFIIIVSVCLSSALFLLYFISILVVLALLIVLDVYSRSQKKPSFGFSLAAPFLWLMLYPPF